MHRVPKKDTVQLQSYVDIHSCFEQRAGAKVENDTPVPDIHLLISDMDKLISDKKSSYFSAAVSLPSVHKHFCCDFHSCVHVVMQSKI